MTRRKLHKLEEAGLKFTQIAQKAKLKARKYERIDPKLSSKLHSIGIFANEIGNAISEILVMVKESDLSEDELSGLLATLSHKEQKRYLRILFEILKYLPLSFDVANFFEQN